MAVKALFPMFPRAELEPRLPDWIEPCWVATQAASLAGIEGAEIGWLDVYTADNRLLVERGAQLKWVTTMSAGVDRFDLAQLKARGLPLTNGAGLNAASVAEYAVLGVLAATKRYDEVVRAADGRRWLDDPPGRIKLEGSRALILGYGVIGRLVGDRLAAFGVQVTGVTRSGRDGTLAAGDWRARLGEFDWVVLATPSTPETTEMLGPAEIAAMKPTAWLVNVARGTLVDQDALIAALRAGRIGGAFLDTVTPEPLPADHELWGVENCMLSMHLSGRSQPDLVRRSADLFLENLHAWREGRPLRNLVDLDAGY